MSSFQITIPITQDEDMADEQQPEVLPDEAPETAQRIEIPLETKAPSPVKLRIALGGVSQQETFLPQQLMPIDNQLQQSAQQLGHQSLTPHPVSIIPQTPKPFSSLLDPVPKPIKRKEPLSLIYKITHKRLNIKLNPKSQSFTAQLIISLELQPNIEKWLETLHQQNVGKLSVELKLNVKQVTVTNICELKGLERGKRFKFDEQSQTTQFQAQTQQLRYPFPLQLLDIEKSEKYYFEQDQKFNGTLQIGSKMARLKPGEQSIEEMKSKLKPHLRILIEYECDKITNGSTVRYGDYKDEHGKRSRYFYTTDYGSECWIPQIIGSDYHASPWDIVFQTPKDYMVICSGTQVKRLVDEQDAVHQYEVQTSRDDGIGFVCCLQSKVVPFTQTKCSRGAYACFLSETKKELFNQAYPLEVMEYLQILLGEQSYASNQLKLVFLPNLLPKKFHRQSISFAEGLHLFDEEILFRPNQIDKRHHFYKHIATALTFDFFGCKVVEASKSDAWLLCAIRERIGDRFRKKKCGTLLYRYQVMRQIERVFMQMKRGAETYPLQRYQDKNAGDNTETKSLGPPHPNEQKLNDIFYRKCGLLMHIIESRISEQTLDKILREIYQEATTELNGQISQYQFRKKFKKICGMHPLSYYKNWIWSTSCPEIELSYEFNKRNNSLDLTLQLKSAVQHSFTQRENLRQKFDKIFKSSKPQDDLNEPIDSFYVDIQQSAKRFFTGDINIVIYQIEGNGGDIIPQQHSVKLKEDFKSTVLSHVNLLGKVTRTTQNRKKDHDVGFDQKTQTEYGKFEMNEFELEDYPSETKNIFSSGLNNSPVLWIRIDPDMEFIRKVEVVPKDSKTNYRNNWLFQLLREQDILGQIEAVRRLPEYKEEFVYEVLKAVARSEAYFYKVRKEVLKSLKKMEVYTFQENLSHEHFLIKLFNKNRLVHDDSAGVFYKENDFSNVLEYYIERELFKAISNCKEENLKLSKDKLREILEKREQRRREVKRDINQDEEMKQEPDEHVSEPINSSAIQLTIHDNKIVKPRQTSKSIFDETVSKCTTENVANMLLRVLKQNDNSENPFDDSFYLRDLIASLGNLDNVAMMPMIAEEIYRQFKLDQISNSSPNFAITLGAIRGYFNLKKQIYRFKTEKLPLLNHQDAKISGYEICYRQVEETMSKMKSDIDKLLLDDLKPLHIRIFIFNLEVKHMLKYKMKTFQQALVTILSVIEAYLQKGQQQFAMFCLRDLVLYFEQNEYTSPKLPIFEVFKPEEQDSIKAILWRLYALPYSFLTQEFSYWVKRLTRSLFGNVVPDWQHQTVMTSDPDWFISEQDLQKNYQDAQNKKDQVMQTQFQQAIPSSSQVQINLAPPQVRVQIKGSVEKGQEILRERDRISNFPQTVPTVIQINTVEDEQMKSEENVSQGQVSQLEEEEEESIYDQFAEIKFDNQIMQKCWLVLGEIFYHHECSEDFLQPITAETLGSKEWFEDYCAVIQTPMDIGTMIERMKSNYYMDECDNHAFEAKDMFIADMMLIFNNCRTFNQKGSSIVKSANKLTNEFKQKMMAYGLWTSNRR